MGAGVGEPGLEPGYSGSLLISPHFFYNSLRLNSNGQNKGKLLLREFPMGG